MGFGTSRQTCVRMTETPISHESRQISPWSATTPRGNISVLERSYIYEKELTALKPLFILLPLLVLGFLLFWTLFGGTLSKDFQFKSAPSEQFTQEEIQDAADVVLRRFKYGFSGCTMTKLQYVDAYASSDTWNWAAEYNADEGVVFHSTFTTDDFFAPKNGFNPNDTYDYQWYVARSNGGHWKIVNLGQG